MMCTLPVLFLMEEKKFHMYIILLSVILLIVYYCALEVYMNIYLCLYITIFHNSE